LATSALLLYFHYFYLSLFILLYDMESVSITVEENIFCLLNELCMIFEMLLLILFNNCLFDDLHSIVGHQV